MDDGTIATRRGSRQMDDEGNPTQATTLIEDGILKGYLQDSLNARLMNVLVTGNARRESYAHLPMPRMTNTMMLNGDKTREEIIASVKHGLYAVNFGGGQVDITSGKFVFSTTEAYMIEDGMIEDGMIEDGMIEDGMIEDGMIEDGMIEDGKIEDGKITRPVKGATLIGNGPDALTRVSMIGKT